MTDTDPTVVAKQSHENRIVESAQIDRQIIRDITQEFIRTAPGLDDDQNLRFQCLALAVQVGPKIRLGKDEDDTTAQDILDIADAFFGYVHDGGTPA